MSKITEQEALRRLTTLCSQAEHCSHEMTEKMRKWELTDEEQARIMEYLTDKKFIDDGRFARAFALDKIRYSKWGRRKVEQALWAKHIDSGIRRQVLDGIGDEEYLKVLRSLLRSRRKGIRAESGYELNMRLMRYAVGRGFGIDLIKECLDGCDDVDATDFADGDGGYED